MLVKFILLNKVFLMKVKTVKDMEILLSELPGIDYEYLGEVKWHQ